MMGKLERHTAAECATVTADNGTEFHSYEMVELATGALFYRATPHHSWDRGTNENTNRLIRQYLPKKTSFAHLTQADCDAIAAKLNSRPRKRLGYRTPEESIYKPSRRERPTQRKRCTSNLNLQSRSAHSHDAFAARVFEVCPVSPPPPKPGRGGRAPLLSGLPRSEDVMGSIRVPIEKGPDYQAFFFEW
jgi:hypothetical protein